MLNAVKMIYFLSCLMYKLCITCGVQYIKYSHHISTIYLYVFDELSVQNIEIHACLTKYSRSAEKEMMLLI